MNFRKCFAVSVLALVRVRKRQEDSNQPEISLFAPHQLPTGAITPGRHPIDLSIVQKRKSGLEDSLHSKALTKRIHN